jgi:hypothetical protein
MNKKRIITLFAAVLGTSLILPLAACGKQDEQERAQINLTEYVRSYSDYAEEMSGTNSNYKEILSRDKAQVTKAIATNLLQSEINYTNCTQLNSGVVIRNEQNAAGTQVYRLYDTINDKYVNDTEYASLELVAGGNNYFFKASLYGDKYAVITCDGEVAISAVEQDIYDVKDPTLSVKSGYYVNGEKGTQVIYILKHNGVQSSGTSYIPDGQYTLYYYLKTDDDGDYTGKIVAAKADEISSIQSYEKNEGYNDIYQNTVASEINGYLYKEDNGTYYFKKQDETKVSSCVTLTATQKFLGFVGDYMYFKDVKVVANGEKKDYNLFINAIKYKETYYRFNIIAGTIEEFTPEYSVSAIYSTLYNYSTLSYDAAIICGYEKVDGVGQNKVMYALVDSKMTVSRTLNNEIVALNIDKVKKLDEKHYLFDYSGNACVEILDENLKPLYLLPEGARYAVLPTAKVIEVVAEGQTTYLDFDGNVILGAEYTIGGSAYAYGGYTYVIDSVKHSLGLINNNTGDGYYLVSPNGTKKSLKDYVIDENTTVDITDGGWFVVKTEDKTADVNKFTYDVYNYAGTRLVSLKGDNFDWNTGFDSYFYVTSTETTAGVTSVNTLVYKVS